LKNSIKEKKMGPELFRLWMETQLEIHRSRQERIREVARQSGVPIWRIKNYLNGELIGYKDRLKLSHYTGLEIEEL